MDSGKSLFNKTTEAVSLDEKIPQSQMEDVQMENYEEVQAPETNPIPIPPKPKPKKAPKKPHVTQNVGPVRYTQANVSKSAVAPPVMRPNRGQRQPRPPSDPPESVPRLTFDTLLIDLYMDVYTCDVYTSTRSTHTYTATTLRNSNYCKFIACPFGIRMAYTQITVRNRFQISERVNHISFCGCAG